MYCVQIGQSGGIRHRGIEHVLGVILVSLVRRGGFLAGYYVQAFSHVMFLIVCTRAPGGRGDCSTFLGFPAK